MTTPAERIRDGLAEAKRDGAYPKAYYAFIQLADIEALTRIAEAAEAISGSEMLNRLAMTSDDDMRLLVRLDMALKGEELA